MSQLFGLVAQIQVMTEPQVIQNVSNRQRVGVERDHLQRENDVSAADIVEEELEVFHERHARFVQNETIGHVIGRLLTQIVRRKVGSAYILIGMQLKHIEH